LELLNNPPAVDKFVQSCSDVMVHVVTFFMRFLPTGIFILLKLDVFNKINEVV
jgi:Na+/H+-dicarboxylate symporter